MCGLCGGSYEEDDTRGWIMCEKKTCQQWYHQDCAGQELNEDDEISFYFECDKCIRKS